MRRTAGSWEAPPGAPPGGAVLLAVQAESGAPAPSREPKAAWRVVTIADTKSGWSRRRLWPDPSGGKGWYDVRGFVEYTVRLDPHAAASRTP